MDESILFIQGCAYPGRIKRAHYDEDAKLSAIAAADPYHMPKGWKLRHQTTAGRLGYDPLGDANGGQTPIAIGSDASGEAGA